MSSPFTKILAFILLFCSAASARTFSIGNTKLFLDDEFLASLNDEQAAYLEDQLHPTSTINQIETDEEFLFIDMELIEASEIQSKPTEGTQPPTK